MTIGAGQLRYLVQFYHQTTTRSATGAVRVGAWEKIFEVWGQFVHLSVKDVVTGQSAGGGRHDLPMTVSQRIIQNWINVVVGLVIVNCETTNNDLAGFLPVVWWDNLRIT